MSIWLRHDGQATMTLAPSARSVIGAPQAGQLIDLGPGAGGRGVAETSGTFVITGP